MAENPAKTTLPPYVSYGAFVSFINRLRESGLPGKIDRTLLGNASGSLVSAMLATLRSLNLTDPAGRPTPAMKALVEAADADRQPLLADLLKNSYVFLFDDPEFDLTKATTGQMSEKFREQDVSGSTIVKCISFFLGLAKAADVTVSSHIKAPTVPRNGKKQGKSSKKAAEPEELGEDEPLPPPDDDGADVHRFEIPIPGKASVKVIVPNDLDADDWEMLQSVFVVYVKRWKGFKPTPASDGG